MAKKTTCQVNWNRIIATFGLTFCTTLVATGGQTLSAVVNALLISGVATFTELKTESPPLMKAQSFLNAGLVI